MFNSIITVQNAEKLHEAIFAEKQDLTSKRANVEISLSNLKEIKIEINAKDFSAYRAM